MTILRIFFFKMLFEKMAFLHISQEQRYLSKKCAGNKAVRFSLNSFLYLNQLVKKYRSALVTDYKGAPIIISLLNSNQSGVFHMKKNLLALLLAGVFIAPAIADKPEWTGKGKPSDEQKAAHQAAMQAKEDIDDSEDRIKEKEEEKEKKEKKEKEEKSRELKGIEKQSLKKSEQPQKELDKGSDKGQESREENSKKWWKFWGE